MHPVRHQACRAVQMGAQNEVQKFSQKCGRGPWPSLNPWGCCPSRNVDEVTLWSHDGHLPTPWGGGLLF
jgi:hypothetical protein